MNIEQFAESNDLYEATELDKVTLIAVYQHIREKKFEFSVSTILETFEKLHLPKPNVSRLKKKLKDSSRFISGAKEGEFKLHGKELQFFKKQFPTLSDKDETIVSEDTILPMSLVSNTRGFIESLSRQINASYQFNVFDGCSVLMRRLLEILLILAYEHCKTASEIKNADDTYIPLEAIIKKAKQSQSPKLSKDSKQVLDHFRVLGNLSAHKIYYNARCNDIDLVKLKYRATIEELLYLSGIKT